MKKKEKLTPKQIKKIRVSVFVTQAKMAAGMDVTITSISNWEMGNLPPNDYNNLVLYELAEENGVKL